MKHFPRLGLAWLLAVLTTTILGVILQTQNVIARLGGIGAEVSTGDRVAMTGYDILHLGSLYGIFIGIAFLIAFAAGGFLYRKAQFGRPLIFALAGFTAILVMLYLMKLQFFDIHIIAGARDAFGILMQMLAGAVGGIVFAGVSRKSADHLADRN